LPDRLGGAAPEPAPARRADPDQRATILRGIAIAAFGYAVITFADAAVKWVLPQTGIAAAIIWRGVIGATALARVMRFRRLWPRKPGLTAARSLLHCTCTAIWFLAWSYGMKLADSYALAAIVPLLVTVLAIPMLGEQVGWRRWASTGVGFCGVLIMLRPGGDLWSWQAAVMLIGVAALSLSRIMTRMLALVDQPAVITFWLMVAHVPVGLLLLPVFPPPSLLPSPMGLVALLFLGCVTGLAHLSFARAFALAPVSVLAPFEYSALLWGLLIGLVFWGEVPAWTTLAGAAVVVAAGLYNLHRERIRRAETLPGKPA
jgi:drug/metabolite transporter (DMT)-like permease